MFTSPCHLNLALLYRPFRRSVKEMLDVWPELPINISLHHYPTKESIDNVIAALRLNHQVSGIDFGKNTSDSAWERFVPLMQQPLSQLCHPFLTSYHHHLPFALARFSPLGAL